MIKSWDEKDTKTHGCSYPATPPQRELKTLQKKLYAREITQKIYNEEVGKLLHDRTGNSPNPVDGCIGQMDAILQRPIKPGEHAVCNKARYDKPAQCILRESIRQSLINDTLDSSGRDTGISKFRDPLTRIFWNARERKRIGIE